MGTHTPGARLLMQDQGDARDDVPLVQDVIEAVAAEAGVSADSLRWLNCRNVGENAKRTAALILRHDHGMRVPAIADELGMSGLCVQQALETVTTRQRRLAEAARRRLGNGGA